MVRKFRLKIEDAYAVRDCVMVSTENKLNPVNIVGLKSRIWSRLLWRLAKTNLCLVSQSSSLMIRLSQRLSLRLFCDEEMFAWEEDEEIRIDSVVCGFMI